MGFAESIIGIRDALIDDLLAAWPELTKVHKVPPELVQEEIPFGWVVRNGPISGDGQGATRNYAAFVVTFNLGGRFEKVPGLNIDDERFRLAGLLYDQLTNVSHHAGVADLGGIVAMLSIEGEPDDKLFEVDIDFRLEFSVERADAI